MSYGPHGMEGMVTVTKVMDKTEPEQLEEKHMEEAYFSQHRSVLILDILPLLQQHIDKYLKELREYNQKLKVGGSAIRIRAKQTVTGRGRDTYQYYGRYAYQRKTADTPIEPEFVELSPEEYNAMNPQEKAKYTKRMNQLKREGVKVVASKDINEVEEKPPRDRWQYVGKVDEMLRDRDLKHLFKTVGNPPYNPLNGLRLQNVLSRGKPTNHVIVPTTALTVPNLQNLFAGWTYYPLRGI